MCTKSPALVAELARAKRKAELEAILERSEVALAHTPAVKASDPGSQALVTYLAALGFVVSVEIVAQWLNLIPVLAIELGSALAAVLVSAVPRTEPTIVTIEPPLGLATHAPEPRPRLLPNHSLHREALAKRILSHLRDHGGTMRGNERSLAKQLGTTKPTLRRTVQGLAATGLVGLQVTKKGTALSLLS